MGETELFLQPGLPIEGLKQQLPQLNGMPRREFQHLIHQYETLGSPPDRVRYPIQVWRFADKLTLIALTGETVVDYSLRFKSAYGWNLTWVFGYNNDLLSYVPSRRVLNEGGLRRRHRHVGIWSSRPVHRVSRIPDYDESR